MTIDGYPVQCTYRDPLIHVADPPTLDPEWVESHCMISKYCLQIAKCDLLCMQDTFARATHSAARPSARATIGYLVYNDLLRTSKVGHQGAHW